MNIFKQISNKPLIFTSVRHYALKNDLKVTWIRPEKVPCTSAKRSGDLSPLPELNKSEYLLEFKKSKELETANEYVKRLFTLGFNSRKYITKTVVNNYVDQVKCNEKDNESYEARIARWTAKIRSWQDLLKTDPYNVHLRVRIKEKIDKRKRYLKFLRRKDYKKFEWLIEQLNIVYKPVPVVYEQVTRKGSLTKLTNKYCDDIRQKKIDEYRASLESQQPIFLQEKLNNLKFIRDEQRDCGVEITVTDEDIEKVQKQIEELNLKKTNIKNK